MLKRFRIVGRVRSMTGYKCIELVAVSRDDAFEKGKSWWPADRHHELTVEPC